jgi:hypothetical protein
MDRMLADSTPSCDLSKPIKKSQLMGENNGVKTVFFLEKDCTKKRKGLTYTSYKSYKNPK